MPDVDPIDQTMGHNDGNQVVSNDAWTYTYDGKGNRTSKTDGVTTTTYTYDFNNRLTSVNDGTNLWEYHYTSSGHRISSVENGVETRWLLDLNAPMGLVLARMDGANAVQDYFVYGDGLLYAVDAATGERHFSHFDPVGSTIAISSLTGAVTARLSYLPFGTVNRVPDQFDIPFTYVGKYGVIEETNGLFFMRARFYDPQTRTFLGRDPADGRIGDPQSLNPYQYVQGNPVLFVDPTGEVRWGLFARGAGEILLGVGGMALGVLTAPTLVGGVVGFTVGGAVFVQGVADIVDSIREEERKTVNPFDVGAGIAAALIWESQAAVDNAVFVSGGLQALAGGLSSLPNPSWIDIGLLAGSAADFIGWNSGTSPAQRGPASAVNSTPQQSHPTTSSLQNSQSGSVNGSASGGSGHTYRNAYAEYLSKNNGPETAKLRRMYHWFRGNTEALEAWMANQQRAPKRDIEELSVAGYAKAQFSEQYRFIMTDNFLDEQTLSYVEYRVSNEVARLAQKRYRYNNDSSKSYRRAKERRAQDVSNSISSLYAQLVSALSKHHVMIRDLSAMPSGATGGIVRTGVYAGGGP